MEEDIKKEIIRLYGNSGVSIGTIRKRLYEKAFIAEDGRKITDDTYIYDVDITFPGHKPFPVSIKDPKEVKDEMEDKLSGWGIKL